MALGIQGWWQACIKLAEQENEVQRDNRVWDSRMGSRTG